MSTLLPDASQTEKSVWGAKRGPNIFFLILLSVFLFPFALLHETFFGAKSQAANHLIGPQWINANSPSLPAVARHKATIVETELGETLCVIGGDSEQVYCYPLEVTGEPVDAGGGPVYSLDEALRYHAATVVSNRTYILGGRVDSDDRFTDKIYCVQQDTGNGAWTPSSGGVMRQKIMQHATVTIGNRIYIIGGCDDEWDFLSNVWSADVGVGCITLSPDDWRTERPLRTGNGELYRISGHTAISVEVGDNKYIYVIGGLNASYSPTNVVLRAEVIDSNGILSDWDDLGTVDDMPGTWLLTAAVSGRYLYVLGGTTSSPSPIVPSNIIYRAKIGDDGELEWLSPRNLPDPLYAHATAVSKPGRLYVVGGVGDNGPQNKIYFTPLLNFEKLAIPSGPVTYGDTINYTLRLSNLGVRDLEGLAITDTVQTNIPAAFKFHDCPNECQVHSGDDDTLTCTVPSLELGETKDLDFELTISQPNQTSLYSPDWVQAPLSSSAPHITWTQTCATTWLEMQGTGIRDTVTDNTLIIANPETIASDYIRAQVALKLNEPTGESKVAVVTFCSSGICSPQMTEPTSCGGENCSLAVYERNVQVSGAISVTVTPLVEGVQESALTAYYLRDTEEYYSLKGQTTNHFFYQDVYTQVLTLPLPVSKGNVTVQVALADNDDDSRPLRITAQAGGVSVSTYFTKPLQGNTLDIRMLQLDAVPSGTTAVTVTVESPPENGDSAGLIGLVASTECAPLSVVNHAQVCEGLGDSQWCQETSYINSRWRVYLPVVLKNAP